MGCQSGICADSSELLLSQALNGKLTDANHPNSEKSTFTSLTSVQRRDYEKSPGTVRKFFLLKSVSTIILKDHPEFSVIQSVLDLWLKELQRVLEESAVLKEDLKTTVTIDSAGESLLIKHELDNVRSFDMLKGFYKKALIYINQRIDLNSIEEKESFLFSLCPLTIIYYISLGKTFDFGLGVNKPMDRKQTISFLNNSKDLGTISSWLMHSNQPISTSCCYSLLSDLRYLNFYIFDGMRLQNVERGLSLFEEFGAAVDSEIKEVFTHSKADEVNVGIVFDQESIRNISVRIESEGVDHEVVKKVDCRADILKWNSFQSLVTGNSAEVELSAGGFTFKRSALL